MIKITAFVVSGVFLLCFAFFNLGKFLDATVEPTKTDLLVCLGGGDYKTRVSKTLELLENGLVNSNTVIFTGNVNSAKEKEQGILEDKRVTFFKNNTSKNVTMLVNAEVKNTAQEVKFVKEYMLKHKLRSVTFVTEPPHSRRILMFSKLITLDADENLSFKVVGSYYKDWNAATYYQNKYAKQYAFTEVLKMAYGVFAYGVLDKLGLLEWFESAFTQEIKQSKEGVNRGMNFIVS
jgi:uncharacterized SAM-binding protein YcdF (DUF218 family)